MTPRPKTRILLAALAAGFVSLAQAALDEIPAPAVRPVEATLATPARAEDLAMLEDRLKETKAISPLKKMGLKGEIDNLLARIRVAHAGGSPKVASLRQPYESLIAKIQGMLGNDPQLASDIVASKDAIWDRLSDRTRFAALED